MRDDHLRDDRHDGPRDARRYPCDEGNESGNDGVSGSGNGGEGEGGSENASGNDDGYGRSAVMGRRGGRQLSVDCVCE